MITVTKNHAFESHKYCTNHLKIDNNEFVVSGTECYVTHLEDYSIVSDFDITEYLELEYSDNPLSIGYKGRKRKRVDSFGNVNITDSLRCIPREIRSKQKDRWINVAHIQSFSRPIITRDRLRDRVCSGQILAYHYKECSIEGNRCIYYGFIPTLNFKSLQLNNKDYATNDENDEYCSSSSSNTDEECDDTGLVKSKVQQQRSRTVDTTDYVKKFGNVKSFFGAHVTAKINVQHVWPRKLYVQLKRDSACSCSNGCLRVSMLTIDDVHATTDARKIIKPKRTYCLKRVPWDAVYIMMGDIDKTIIERLKEHRMCKSCAQCRKCLNSPIFCRDHKRCKHEKTIVDVSSFDISLGMPKIKKCRKIT